MYRTRYLAAAVIDCAVSGDVKTARIEYDPSNITPMLLVGIARCPGIYLY